MKPRKKKAAFALYKNMNPSYKILWLEALRSGKYKQGPQFLHTISKEEEKFCCLGVLCNAAGVPASGAGRAGSLNEYNVMYGSFGMRVLDSELLKKFGITYETMGRLSLMNDAESKTFFEIADWIEENL